MEWCTEEDDVIEAVVEVDLIRGSPSNHDMASESGAHQRAQLNAARAEDCVGPAETGTSERGRVDECFAAVLF